MKMLNMIEQLPIHREVFGSSITALLVSEASRVEELREGYTLYLIEDEKMVRCIQMHFERLPGRNLGDLLDVLDAEMKAATAPVDEFPMFDENQDFTKIIKEDTH
jgi:hypothetical protein